jgi:predicted Ser/Thr protein kinase
MKRCPTCRRVYENQAAVCQVDGTALAEPTVNADTLIGQMVTSRYRLVRKLGGTGLGVVYLAEEVATGNQVAVKLLLSEIRRDAELVKQFWWGARLAAASNPARIARVYEVDRTEDGRVFIAMEYLEGENLAELLRREGPLERGRAMRLAIQIAEGLASASQAGVTHRNLKPQNVMIIGADRVRLTDFGVGRLRETALGGRPSGPNQIAPEYLAPEQLKGNEVNFRADIYALGAVLYTMLAGTAPAPPPGNGQEPIPLRKLRPEIPDAVEQFVLRAMERRPDRRHGGMEEVIERLRALTTHAGVEPAPAPTPSPAPAPSPVAALETVSEEPPSRQPEPAMASLLTLLNDAPSPVTEWKAPAEWKLQGRVRRTGAIVWFWCLGALAKARTGLTNAAPSVARWGSRFVLAVLGLIVLASQQVTALWHACGTWLARGWSYVAACWSRLAASALGVAGLVRRRSENLWVASLDGWQRTRTGTPRPQPDAEPAPSRLSSWAFGVGRFDRLRDGWWRSLERAQAGLATRRFRLNLWWSYRGKLLVTGVAAVVVVGVTTWALLDWTGGGKTKRPSPDESRTADAGISVAQLRELENERKREEARALRPIIPERRAEPVAQADEERRRQAEPEAIRRVYEELRGQAQLEANRRTDEERRRQAEVEATRRAEEERRRQTELEARRRADEERRRQAELEAARRAE